MTNIIKPFDYALIVVVCVAIAIISFRVYAVDNRPPMVSVKSESGLSLYTIETERHVEVDGPLGITHIEIADGKARVVSSPCRDKLCLLKGDLVKNGDWTACMPNKVYVGIQGKKEEELDGLSY
ncbi:NusG domain II-containing protein [Desulfosediminicola flagellatus]|uniref:NusG domain II-containing protein n=1 Tax=Desulfosediminicola flagellatus TaxID=2569541 RepID=UPI001C3DC222|nr:NusG domain II-containing protein [Desulfosediminicola flagellatus]